MERFTATLPALGEIVGGRYRLTAVLGRGGMGTVFKCEHINMSKTMALKMLTAAKFDERALRRFNLEAKLAGNLDHPNIVKITDFDSDHGRPFLVMDYLKGKSLERLIEKEHILPLDRFENIMQQACRALAYAHKNGVVHRDIKLSNMMLTERGGERDVLVLVDFGLIKVVTDQIAERQSQEVPDEAPSGDHPGLTQANTVVGSPLFMSPEQIRGLRVDHRSDIYSLGCVMYNCLTGRVPFEGSETHQTFYKHIYENPAPFSQINPQNKVPEALEAVVMRALAKDPDERYQDVQQLADDISRALKRRRLIDEVDASNLSNESSLLNSKRITQLHSESTVRLLSIALVVVVLGLGFLYYKFAQQLDRQDRPAPATQTHSPEALPASKSREQ